jgi:hypothetical protein
LNLWNKNNLFNFFDYLFFNFFNLLNLFFENFFLLSNFDIK